MKKFILGSLVGGTISLSSSALAAKVADVSLFPVKFIFNHEEKQLSEAYVSLNYNGHVYVRTYSIYC